MILREYVNSILNEEYNLDAIINDLADKIHKSGEKHIEAIHRGKRSSSTVNVKRLAEKYGLPESDLDLAADMGTMATLSRNLEDIKAAIRPYIERAYKKAKEVSHDSP